MPGTEKNAASRVLRQLIAAVGIEKVAHTLLIPSWSLEPFLDGERLMSLHQQRTLAVATLVLSDNQSDLRRAGSALLAQVAAAEDFAAGVTARHTSPPSTQFWR